MKILLVLVLLVLIFSDAVEKVARLAMRRSGSMSAHY
jgi:hypothetical protein